VKGLIWIGWEADLVSQSDDLMSPWITKEKASHVGDVKENLGLAGCELRLKKLDVSLIPDLIKFDVICNFGCYR
jgi:hypothetical protein